MPSMVFLVSVPDRVKRALYEENLRSQAIDYEIRNGQEFFVREDELEAAKHILREGQWEY